MKFRDDTPLCFDSKKQFDDWKREATTCHELSTICTDCLPTFEFAMKAEGRCEKSEWVKVLFAPSRTLLRREKSERDINSRTAKKSQDPLYLNRRAVYLRQLERIAKKSLG
jgi:hypothetical protein